MKLWSALAVQILAIVLREHHRDPFRSCREPAPIEVVCNCTEATPTAVASVSPGVLVGAGACCNRWDLLVDSWLP